MSLIVNNEIYVGFVHVLTIGISLLIVSRFVDVSITRLFHRSSAQVQMVGVAPYTPTVYVPPGGITTEYGRKPLATPI